MKQLITLIFLLITNTAHAVIVTHGYLTYDDNNTYIVDTSTGRLYSSLDQTGLTYGLLLNEISDVNSAWYGWSIATSVESDDFINVNRPGFTGDSIS